MDSSAVTALVDRTWDDSILPVITEYITIPNKSPLFDPEWKANGHMDRAVELIAGWCREQPIEGMTLEVIELEGRTPLIYMDIPGEGDDCVVLYGHLDKQPEMEGWNEGLGPWIPVRDGDKLYGRGGADDGYAAFASLTAIRALREAGGKHARCVVIIEGCEESGSYDLPYYIDHIQDRIGTPSLVICLDSGCGNYEQLWCTTSLRGIVSGDLEVRVLGEGVHSGDASGIVPSSFRVLRELLDRVDDAKSGEVLLDALRVQIPDQRAQQAEVAARVLGDEVFDKFPWAEGMVAVASGREAVLNRTWRPALSVTGMDGVPGLQDAGNVLRPFTTAKLSMRIPPMVDADAATQALKAVLERDPPYGAQVTFHAEQGAAGWNAPPLADWLADAVEAASQTYFGRESVWMGEGGTIPFMGMLGEKFPEAQFMITGLLGPGSNAHGPNEFLHVPCGKKLTASVAHVLGEHFKLRG
ncbi:MAG: M20 family metallopeptidase [Planctomycetes bacterium]|jgi:acetylornithine deacetylase/succinyl-diaminopimelate desuccinylase-like protein|nr:M20 family metallopeptidase [Planctomycetota bacterium]